ncbi:MAG: trehalose operon repressor [Lactobacillaceae bacterium]|jgi:GntR family trehalose operon transcriptional repressor|nr:trehalose operon repressor [Lactobacillaceae bacterium]
MKVQYKIIYQQLKEQILSNQIPAGDLLPSEPVLRDTLGVSRDTVRKALNLLEQDGLIQKKKGKGSFVLNHTLRDFPLSDLRSFSELTDQQGFTAQTQLIQFKSTTITAETTYTGFPIGTPVWYIGRLRIINDAPEIIDFDFIKQSVVPELTEAIAQQSLYHYLEQTLALPIAYAKKVITAAEVTTAERQLLALPADEKRVMQIDSQVFLDNTEQFQFTMSKHRPDRFEFHDFARRLLV